MKKKLEIQKQKQLLLNKQIQQQKVWNKTNVRRERGSMFKGFWVSTSPLPSPRPNLCLGITPTVSQGISSVLMGGNPE